MDENTGATTTAYAVSGMTCGHCATAVGDELRRIPGVSDVAVDLVPGGSSTVTVTSERVLDEDDVRRAVDEAGYDLTGART
jgi:copper chaperone CopZ